MSLGSEAWAFCFHNGQDQPAQVEKDREMIVLKEMNERQEFESENWRKETV